MGLDIIRYGSLFDKMTNFPKTTWKTEFVNINFTINVDILY